MRSYQDASGAPYSWPGTADWPPPSTFYVDVRQESPVCPQGWEFLLYYNEPPDDFGGGSCCRWRSPTVSVVKIESLTWEKGDPTNLDLDDCPNNGGKRIFPDKFDPGDNNPSLRQEVNIVGTVTPPLPGVTVYFKVFDVDDPFDQEHASMPDVNRIDDNATGPDNCLNSSPCGEAPVTFSAVTNESGIATAAFTVSMQPGNNYRAAASLIEAALNQYTIFAGEIVDPQEHADALNIVGGGSPGYSTPCTWSEMLTVWRKLHVELDSMAPVTGNEIVTIFTDIEGAAGSLTKIKGIPSFNDGSLDLDTKPQGNGRFENGTLTIGTPPSTVTISPILANGHNSVEFPPTGMGGLPFSAVDNDASGNGTISGVITTVSKSGNNYVWSLTVTAQNENQIDWPDFVGGSLSVGGGANVLIVGAVGGAWQLTTNALDIPCRMHDDDDDTLLNIGRLPDTSTLAAAFQPAYVVPVYDVGDNNINVPFVLNVPATDSAIAAASDWDSKPTNSSAFWVVYLLGSYQYQASDRDGDPDTEASTWGATSLVNGGCLVFYETIRDDTRLPEPTIVVHETGHAVGRSGDHPVTANQDTGPELVANYLAQIRISPHPSP